jgi:flagellum-specific ATP synthase
MAQMENGSQLSLGFQPGFFKRNLSGNTQSRKMEEFLKRIEDEIDRIPDRVHYGRVSAVSGMLVEVRGLTQTVAIGGQCMVTTTSGQELLGEVVGFRDGRALLMPFGKLEGIGLGCRVTVIGEPPTISPSSGWLGRVVDALGNPLDGKGPLPRGLEPTALKAPAPDAHSRQRMAGKIDLGVRALNAFLTMCRGQRMGIFSGSGVGKSTMMSMLARANTASDVAVIGLIGERGREVQEFIEDDLGEEGLKRAVVVVATGDQPPLMRRQAAYTTMAIAEYFRRQNKHVLCMMDSVTRFAMAQREIGLSAGEPPTSKGYPPTTFGELAKLLERAGPGPKGEGNITGLFSVLVEGDDHNEPIADAVRGIIDGHIVLDRAIAQRGRYPAINILKSVSRALPKCNEGRENELIQSAREMLATYEDMAELIRLGAYRKGSDAKVDRAIELYDGIETFLKQDPYEQASMSEGYAQLAAIMEMPWGGDDMPTPQAEE